MAVSPVLASKELPVLLGSTPGGGDSLPARGRVSRIGGTCAPRTGFDGDPRGLSASPKPVKSSAGSGTKAPPVVAGLVSRDERREANCDGSD